jgi:hypothetical protein
MRAGGGRIPAKEDQQLRENSEPDSSGDYSHLGATQPENRDLGAVTENGELVQWKTRPDKQIHDRKQKLELDHWQDQSLARENLGQHLNRRQVSRSRQHEPNKSESEQKKSLH